MKRVLAGAAILALHCSLSEQAGGVPDSMPSPPNMRPGAPGQLAPPPDRQRVADFVSSDPQMQVRDLRTRLEALDRRVAELERRLAPAQQPSDRKEPLRIR